MNYFIGNKDHPRHVSVGAVLRNDNGEVLVHHYTDKHTGYWAQQGLTNFYTLMRQTLRPGQSLEEALAYGLQEEFGVTAEIGDYIGSIISHLKDSGVEIEKTTLYFSCRTLNQDLSKRRKDPVEDTILEWHKPEFLIPIMREQAAKYGRTDIDESPILAKVLS